MISEDFLRSLTMETESKIVLLVIDGVGGLPKDGETELEAARTPNLDELATRSICGLADPIGYGITPGSGPAHLALFGYDPLNYEIGRGVLEALGIGLEMTPDDVAARGNFATMNEDRIVTDRRAGRIPTEKSRELCALLSQKIREISGIKVIIEPGKEHRFVALFRGKDLSGNLTDADPQKEGKKLKATNALSREAERTAEIVNRFIEEANRVLKNHQPANAILLRGFAKYPSIPRMQELFKLRPAAIATYPMYKGLAKLVGMEILECGERIEDQFASLKRNFERHDFFYLHIKKTDSFGEDGNFDKKVEVIENVDRFIPQILELRPEVIAVTGDHSTPSVLKSHSWHPNPFLLYSDFVRVDEVKRFTERECVRGGLGRFPASFEISLLLANGLKLKKFGA
jgi:2,3-bisphosphoglycerate-independent phosphoglycerate mutase